MRANSMNSLVTLVKRQYWEYCISPKKNRITGFAFSVISRILIMLSKAIFLKPPIENKINVFLVLLETNDNIIYESINRNQVKSTKYLSQNTLIERENISNILFYYFVRSNKIEFGIKVFKELTATDPDNKNNWRGLLDLPFYINDEKRLNKYFEQYIDFKNNQAISDAIDIENNIYVSEYFTHSIGHLSIIVNYALIMQIENNGNDGSIFISLANAKIANQSILDSIKNTFKNIQYVNEADIKQTYYTKKYENPFVYKIKLNNQWCNWYEVRPLIFKKSGLANLNGLLKIPDKCKDDGLRFMQSFGFSKEDWFVSIHIRERNDGSLRNSKINNYIEAIREITRKGGWVVRLGGNDSIPLPRMKKVIDYSQFSEQSHFLDTYFLAECFFSIQTTSGPANIPILFGKPTIQADCFPIRHTVPCYKDIFIPKLIYSKKLKRILNFSEVFRSGISSSEIHLLMDGLSVVNNSSVEILEACKEMLASLELPTVEDLSLWQIRFNDISRDNNVTIFPKISKYFIESHKHLIE
jgi:putative glycosyltransferase (TIGR04372 family)